MQEATTRSFHMDNALFFNLFEDNYIYPLDNVNILIN